MPLFYSRPVVRIFGHYGRFVSATLGALTTNSMRRLSSPIALFATRTYGPLSRVCRVKAFAGLA